MSRNQAYDAKNVELPSNASSMTLEALRRSASANGFDLTRAAKLQSAFDWMNDMVWLQAECRAHDLSIDQRDVLVDRLRQRSKEAWGPYSTTDGWSVYDHI